MIISPSIASGDSLRLADEIALCDECFDAMHLDVADGVAVRGITFGLKTCVAACELSSSSSRSIHLEVNDPLSYVADLRCCDATELFVQTDNLTDPVNVLRELREANLGMTVGANLGNLDVGRTYLDALLAEGGPVLIGTTAHDDPAQVWRRDMVEFAIWLAEDGREVWVDGGITPELIVPLAEQGIHAVVLGRAVFKNRERARCLARQWQGD